MDSSFPVPLIVLAVAAVIAIAVFSMVAAAKRRKELLAWAAGRGLSFDASKDSSIEDRYPRFACFREGSNRYADNLLRGQWANHGFLGFDYHYTTRSTNSKGQSSTTHHSFSAVILTSNVLLKPLLIRPEHFLDKVAAFFGAEDIDFESAEFSRKFFVKSPDKKWAYDVLHPRAIEMLLASPRFTVQFDNLCVLATNGRNYSAGDFEAAATVLAALLDEMPDYLVKQQKELMGQT